MGRTEAANLQTRSGSNRLRTQGKAAGGPPTDGIRPAAGDERGFSEADLARATLIRDLEDTLGFDEEQVPVLLNLIDQIHGLRAEMKTLLEAYEGLPEDSRKRVKVLISRRKTRRR